MVIWRAIGEASMNYDETISKFKNSLEDVFERVAVIGVYLQLLVLPRTRSLTVYSINYRPTHTLSI